MLLGACWKVQGQSIDYQTPQKPITEILQDISQRYGLFFSYSSELLAPYQASIEARNQPMEDFLAVLLDPLDLQAVRSKGNYFFIQKARRKINFQIRDQASSEPLAYAIVRSLSSRRGAYADAEGIATLEYDAREDSVLLVQHLGYVRQRIRLKGKMPDRMLIELKQDSMDLEEVLIEYHNDAITLREGAQFNLLPGRMKVLPGLAEADVLLSVQSLPGISSNDETASGINVRGGGSDELMVYWDRIPVYKQAHFFGTITTFIPSTVAEISAYKNYIPAQFTGATSGLLEIRLPDSIPDRYDAIVNANLTHSDLMVHIPWDGKVALMLAGRISYHDQFDSPTFASHRNKLFAGTRQEDILQIIIDDDDEEEIPVLREQTSLAYRDLNAKLVFKPGDRDYVSVSLIQNTDRFSFNAQSNETSILAERTHDVSFWGGNFFYSRNWNARLRSELSMSYSDYELANVDLGIFDDGEERNEQTIENFLTNAEAKISLAYQVSPRSTFHAGYQFNAYNNFFEFNEVSTFEGNFQDTLEAAEVAQGIFARYHYSWKDKIDFQPQLRIDRVPGLDETLVNPVIALHYKILPALWLKSSYGHYFQLIRSLQQGDLDVSNVSESVWLLAEGPPIPGEDEELPLIESRQLSVGGLYKQKGWLIDLDLYWKYTDDLSSINQFNRNSEIEFSLGEARALGLDFMIKKKFGRYQSWMSYSYSEVTNSFEELRTPSFPSSFDRPHQFRWVHNLYLAPIEISLGWMFRSGTPYTRPTGLTFFPDDPDDPEPDEGSYELNFGPINGSRLPFYHRLDLSVWYKFETEPGGFSGQLGFSIQNLYNRENVWQRFYFLEDVDEDLAPEIVEEERYFLGFTPNVSVRLNF